MERQLLADDPPETACRALDGPTARLLEAACLLLAGSEPRAQAISVTTTDTADGWDAIGVWLYGKLLAREHGLHASACLSGRALTVSFKRQPG
jgi:hypothetical protein